MGWKGSNSLWSLDVKSLSIFGTLRKKFANLQPVSSQPPVFLRLRMLQKLNRPLFPPMSTAFFKLLCHRKQDENLFATMFNINKLHASFY